MNQVKWQALSTHFEQKRGEGMSYHTIQAWMVRGMPYSQPSPHRIWFDPEACWRWYLETFTVERAG